MQKPTSDEKALRAYNDVVIEVTKKLQTIDNDLKKMQPAITEIEEKLSVLGKNGNIQKAVHQILMNDRRNRDKLRKANEHLENAMEALRQVVFAEAIKDEYRTIFTTRQLYEILRRQYYAQKRDYLQSVDNVAKLKKKVISPNRALSMAEDLYLKGARKKLRADIRRLKKRETMLSAPDSTILQER